VRADDAYDERMTQAWWTAGLTGRKLPDLKTLLSKRQREAMNLAQMKTAVAGIAAVYKLPLRKGKKKKGKKR
jgi:hypothetical protein